METNDLQGLTMKVKEVMRKYEREFPDVKVDRDYYPFKITEEWGECLQAYLMMTNRGREKGKSKDEIKEMFSQEIADVFGPPLYLRKMKELPHRSAFT